MVSAGRIAETLGGYRVMRTRVRSAEPLRERVRSGLPYSALQALGDWVKAVSWLRHPNRALGWRVPLQHLDTDLGVREVETVLMRIEHGVYS